MNNETQLLVALDNMFGVGKKIRSSYRKLRQGFDEKTNEHVFIIEYRTVAEGTMKNQPRVDPQQQQMTLLRQLVAQSKTE